MTLRTIAVAFACLLCSVAAHLHAQQNAAPPVVPKWLAAPRVDGRCDDTAYENALRVTAGRAPISLVHDGVELFVCLDSLPAAARSVSLWLDPEGGERRGMGPAQLVVRAWPDGRLVARQGTAAESAPQVEVAASQFRTVGGRGAAGSWASEVAVPLTWLGGAGTAAGLRVSLDGGPAEAVAEWPEGSDEFRPASWERVAIGPVPAQRVRAGSAFVDGRGGYLVLPYTPALAGNDVTIEAWVRVVDGDCGTLIGGGFDHGYWIGICDVVRYRRPGGTYTRTGRTTVTHGWHHIALTVNARGEEVLYVDGVVDQRVVAQEREDEAETRAAIAAPASVVIARVPHRVGSDPQAPDDLNYLHAFISDLRIWSRARTESDIRRGAMEQLSGPAPALVGSWHFADGFGDAASGRRVGVVGFASLAIEPRDARAALRAVPSGGPPVHPARPLLPPWDGRLPIGAGAVQVDGWCRPDEYEQSARIPLEPARGSRVRAMIANDALYLCSGVLVGAPDRGSSFTVHLARDGGARTARSPDDLEIVVSGDGSVAVRPQDERVPVRDSMRSVVVAVVGGPRLNIQPDDLRPLDAPWWSAELRIPLTALAPFRLEDPRLRIALDYEADLRALSSEGARRHGRGRWPAAFDPAAPASWGAGSGTRAPVRVPTRVDLASRPAFDPTISDFYVACPTTPNLQLPVPPEVGYATDSDEKWPLVDPEVPFVWVDGTLASTHISREDSPFIHSSHDVDMKIVLRAADRWLALTEANGDPGDTLILESESAGLPARARALPGDRVIAGGRWIFDCGHAPKTEIHPTPVFITDRLEWRPVRPDKAPQQVRVIRIWINSNPGAFSYEFSGTVAIRAKLPGGFHPFARVVEAGLVPLITRLGDSVEVQVTPPAQGKAYVEIVLGMLSPGSYYGGGKPYTVSVEQIDVLDDHDSGTDGDGEWTLAMHLNGAGRTIWDDAEIDDDDNPYNIHQNFLVAGEALQLHASGFENDDGNLGKLPENYAGDDIGQSKQAFWLLGSLADLCCGSTHTFNAPGGSWRMRYHVTEGAPALNALPVSAHPFWTSRLYDEPNDQYKTSLGTITPTAAAPAIITHGASLIEAPLITGGVHLLGSDEDRYQIMLGDFATLTADLLEVLPANVAVVPGYPTYSDMPQAIKDMIGYVGAEIYVNTPGDWGDLPYTLRVRATYKVLPPDWGEVADTKPGGRIMDLVTPDPATEVFTGQSSQGWPMQPYRRLTADWAWQHVAGDADTYTVLFPLPAASQANALAFACKYNEPPALELRAFDQRIIVPSLGLEGNGYLEVTGGLSGKFPGGKARVMVLAGPKRPRHVYRMTAKWRDALYLSPSECAARADFEAALKASAMTVPTNMPPFAFPNPQPDPELISPTLGAGVVYAYIPPGAAGSLDIVAIALDEQPVVARVYNLDGVLLAESAAPDARGAARLLTLGMPRTQGLILQVVPGVMGTALGTVGLKTQAW